MNLYIRILVFSALLVQLSAGVAQNCNTPGQTPSTAFPVCGTATFVQSSVNLCGGRAIPNPKCTTTPLEDKNPYWYKFTCFQPGTLGFTITPNSATSDYDWQLFDVTGRNPDSLFFDPRMVISCNWSEYFGPTGTTATAVNLLECEGKVPQFSKMPLLEAGHQYLLLVSHFSNSQAGYRLDFSGGTAVITDTLKPALKAVYSSCDNKTFRLKLNKRMKCASIAANGSDWSFVQPGITIASAAGVGCSGGFDTDSILITTSAALAPGRYTLRSKKGSDNNTILDICDEALPEGDTLSVEVRVLGPVLIDSIMPVACSPRELELVMADDIACTSIAADGSDFIVSGPAAVSVSGASALACAGGLARRIVVKLSDPVLTGGVYTVRVKTGSDGNTLTSACNIATPAGTSAQVSAFDTVRSSISYVFNSSCLADTIRFTGGSGNGINSWRWSEEATGISGTGPAFERIFNDIGDKVISLVVTNGICTDSSSVVISLQKIRVNAAFEYPQFACPNDTIRFVDKSTGPIFSWKWTFGNGNTSTLAAPPPQLYSSAAPLSSIPVTLVVGHINGCKDTVTHTIQVPNNCFIAVPSGFTPNGDGLNDYLYPLNAWKAKDLHFRVYNRYGQLVWETRDWTRKWDGTINGKQLDAGTYVWMLQYTDTEKGNRVFLKGTTVLVR